jgi:hypothetical protein
VSQAYSIAQQFTAFVACSSGAILAYQFGFDASFVRVSVRGAVPAYVSLYSTTATTSTGHYMACSNFFGTIPPTRMGSFVATASGTEFSLLALGY